MESKIEKLAKSESDRENCLIIIKMACLYLRNAYNLRGKVKEVVSGPFQRKSTMHFEKIDEETLLQNYINELKVGNNLIINVLQRFLGDTLFMYISLSNISEYLFDNLELTRVFLNCLFICDEKIHHFIFYEEELEENIMNLIESCGFKVYPNITKFKDWNLPILFKAFDMILFDRANFTELSQTDYRFIEFIQKNGLSPMAAEIWKNNFRFSKILIQDFRRSETCLRSLSVFEVFLYCEPIQKNILEENFDILEEVFKEILADESDNGKICRDHLSNTLTAWLAANWSQIFKDLLKKLAEPFNLI